MSDWDGTHSTVKAATAGLDQEQPERGYFEGVKDEGIKRRSRMATCRLRCSTTWCIEFSAPCSRWARISIRRKSRSIDAATDAAVAQEMEEQGAVLLKNAGGQLPLSKSVKSIAVIGSHADIAVLSGGGSAQVTPVGGAAISNPAPCPPCWGYVVWDPSSPLKAIQAKVPGATVKFDDGTSTTSAAALAAASDVAVVFVSQWESEGMDPYRPQLLQQSGRAGRCRCSSESAHCCSNRKRWRASNAVAGECRRRA